MNLVINLRKKKITRMEINEMKKFVFIKLWSTTPIAKLKVFVFKTKCLERSTWIKNGVVMKEGFKNWKALLASTPQEKGRSFLVNWIRRATI